MLDPETGDVLDLVGGKADLAAGVIRAIGDPKERFAEDHLRLIRAVRFAARFGFTIEPDTGEAIRCLAPDLATVAPERLREELVRLLTEGPPDLGVRMLDDYGLLPVILPEVSALKGGEQPAEFHPEGDVFVHTLLCLKSLPPGPSPELAMGALLHDIGKPATFTRDDRIRFTMHPTVGIRMAREICLRLRFSNQETDQILALVSEHMRFIYVQKMRESTLKRFFRLDRFEEHLALHLADCQSCHGDVSNHVFCRARLEEFAREQKPLRPLRLVTGDDLIRLGYKPGAGFKTMLEWAEDAQLEGRFGTKEEGGALVRQEFPPPVAPSPGSAIGGVP